VSPVAAYHYQVSPRPAIPWKKSREPALQVLRRQLGQSARLYPDDSCSEGTINNVNLSCKRQADYYAIEFQVILRFLPMAYIAYFWLRMTAAVCVLARKRLSTMTASMASSKNQELLPLGRLQPIRILFFEKSGGDHISLSISGPGMKKQPVSDSMLFMTEK